MPEPKPAQTRPLRLILVLLGAALVVVAGLAWLNRKALAREALTGWLKSKGVASDATVEAFGPTTFTARMRIGDPKSPDFVAERVEVRYRPRLSGIEIVSVTMTKPVLRASYQGGQLGVGALDPLVKDFLSRPPPPNAKLPRFLIDGGVLMLATDYGPVRLAADALVDDSKLQRLTATSAPMRLKGPGFDVAVGAGSLKTVTRAGRLDLTLAAPLPQATFGEAKAQDGRLTLTAQLPYPDFMTRRGEGAVSANLRVTSRRLDMAGQSLDGADLSVALTGQSTGWIPDLAVSGQAAASLSAGAGRFGGADVRTIRASAHVADLRWTRKGGDRVAATLRLNGGLEGLAAGDLRLSALTLAATGPVAAGGGAMTADLTGSAVGRGGWSGLGAPTAADSGEMAAIKKAARGFRIAAPAVSVRFRDGLTVGLPKPVSLVPDGGGAVQLAAYADAPLFGPRGGAFRLKVSGGGLPGVEAEVARLTLADGDLTASGRLRAKASVGLVEGSEVDASGRLQMTAAGMTFTADRCATLKVGKLEFGANDIEALSGRLCPTAGPLFSLRGGDWTLAGRAEAVTAAAPFAQVRAEGAALRFTAASARGRLNAKAQVTAGQLRDTAPQARFNPLMLSGDITFKDFLWKANLAARQPNGTPVGRVELAHDTGLGIGLVILDTDTLTFADGGLQPVQLSPLAGALGSPVVGSAHFKGRFDWAREGASSSGTLSIPSLSFQSVAGPVEGLKGELAFSSLAPLIAAPGQQLTIDKVAAIVPLTDVKASLELSENLLKIAGGEAAVGGGRILVESLEYPLTPGAPLRGVVIFEGVQLHDLVEASPFGDKVDLDAKVSGRMAFEANANKVRVTGGELKADQPGRISIDRTALTGVQADTAIAAPAPVADPNATFTDFAYQAMEHLAFQTLEATVASRDDGRLGVLFHIVGKHDPPTKQRIKLTIMDLIQKRFLGRTLPLPSGTGVNLTLDTTLNLDDLLADYAEYQRARSSAPVQP